jgi:predicted DNA-binding protein with PD1-like motif
MKSKLLHEDGTRTFAVIFDKGDDPYEGLTAFAAENGLDAARITAIGAFRSATLGYFDPEAKEYERFEVDEQVEVLSFIGDIARSEGDPAVHVHVVLGKRGGATVGGHLFAGQVWPTLEVLVTESPDHLAKTEDPETGLALIDIDAS